MYHKYDQMVTKIRSMVNRHKYGSDVARRELVIYLREMADKLEREENMEQELKNQLKLGVD